jgi:hypothetical protein
MLSTYIQKRASHIQPVEISPQRDTSYVYPLFGHAPLHTSESASNPLKGPRNTSRSSNNATGTRLSHTHRQHRNTLEIPSIHAANEPKKGRKSSSVDTLSFQSPRKSVTSAAEANVRKTRGVLEENSINALHRVVGGSNPHELGYANVNANMLRDGLGDINSDKPVMEGDTRRNLKSADSDKVQRAQGAEKGTLVWKVMSDCECYC